MTRAGFPRGLPERNRGVTEPTDRPRFPRRSDSAGAPREALTPLYLSGNFRGSGRQARGSVVERFLDTEEVDGSIPSAPTSPRGWTSRPEESNGPVMLIE